MGFLGGFEWLIIILVLLFLFGARKIPDMARGIGRGIFEFRKAVNDGKKEMSENPDTDQKNEQSEKQTKEQYEKK